MDKINRKRVHFHTFDSLRFLAFLVVFLMHSPIPKNSILSYLTKSGGIGVIFFFVLSGFLITYILLIEKLNKNTINLREFFRRRILRIWPLFYAMLLFAFCTPYVLDFFQIASSNVGYEPNWLMSIAFLENYRIMYTHQFPNVSPLIVMWTLCIEEHFYIVWGILMYFLPLKKMPNLILLSIIFSLICIVIYNKFGISTGDLFTNIGFFAFGAVPAYLFVFKKDVIEKVNRIPKIFAFFYAVLVVVMMLLISNVVFNLPEVVSALIFGILFSGLLLLTLGENSSIKISDKTWIAQLGKYTYGLYLIHPIAIVLFLKIGEKLHWNGYEITVISFILTVILAFLSYHLFEKQFLKLKKKIS